MNEGEIREWLRRRAEELASLEKGDMRALLDHVGIKIRELTEKETALRDGQARKVGSGYEVVYVEKSPRRTQFTLAHELGHILLDRELGIRPQERREYWLHENLCDDFAGYLLIPSSVVSRLQLCNSIVDAVDKVVDDRHVSLEAAIRRLTPEWSGYSTILGAPRRNKQEILVFRVKCAAGLPVEGVANGKDLLPHTQLGALFLRMHARKEWAPLSRMLWPGARVEGVVRQSFAFAAISW